MMSKDSEVLNRPKNTPNELLTPKSELVLFTWKDTTKNEKYFSSLVTLPNVKAVKFNDLNFPNRVKFDDDAQTIILQKKVTKRQQFESCLIHDKSDINFPQVKQHVQREILIIEKEPKYLVTLDRVRIDTSTAEITTFEYYSDTFKQSNNRKIKALDKFCKFYQPLYKSRLVSLFFVTLTAYDKAQIDIKQFIDAVKLRLKRNDQNMLGYIWTLEVSEGNHAHYHLCFATKRINIVGSNLPEHLKFESLWGTRTEIDFVKKNVRHYLAKYFAKHNYRIFEHRSYAMSNKLNLPT